MDDILARRPHGGKLWICGPSYEGATMCAVSLRSGWVAYGAHETMWCLFYLALQGFDNNNATLLGHRARKLATSAVFLGTNQLPVCSRVDLRQRYHES